MRRVDREVKTPDEVRQIIERCDVCRIALVDKGVPYIVPLNFGYEYVDTRLTLWFHCAPEGRKLDLIGAACMAGFEMDCDHALVTGVKACEYTMSSASVIGHGRIASVQDEDERLHGLRRLMAHYDGEGLPFSAALVAKTCVLRLDVVKFSVKRLAR